MDALKAEDQLKADQDIVAKDFTRLSEWYTGVKADVDALGTLKAEGKWKDGKLVIDANAPHVPARAPEIDPTKYISREDFAKESGCTLMDITTAFEPRGIGATGCGRYAVCASYEGPSTSSGSSGTAATSRIPEKPSV
jgi:hypothetical protein